MAVTCLLQLDSSTTDATGSLALLILELETGLFSFRRPLEVDLCLILDESASNQIKDKEHTFLYHTETKIDFRTAYRFLLHGFLCKFKTVPELFQVLMNTLTFERNFSEKCSNHYICVSSLRHHTM